MNRNAIRIIILLGTISIIGIIAIQAYWVSRAFDLKEQQFKQTVNIALRNVAYSISSLYNTTCVDDPVNQISSDYYVVNVNTTLDADVLEHYLKEEFKRHLLSTDFEYGIYNCDTQKMAYGAYINSNYDELSKTPNPLPKSTKYLYYFGIRFPKHTSYLASKLDIWLISSLITFLVTAFFAYAMFVILKQRRLSEIQRDFVNNMTHEFQTPISTIKVAADVLDNPNIMSQPERFKRYVQIIKQENNRLKNQVETLLHTAQSQKGSIELQKQVVDLHQLIEESTVSKRFDKPEDITLQLDAQRPSIQADRIHTMSMISNLLDNAVKYSREHIDITIKTENKAQGICLSISDKGIGIEKEYQHKIFDKFYRVPTGNVHNVKGFGLGLNYIKQIIDAHRWKITLESEANAGSTFRIYIPQP